MALGEALDLLGQVEIEKVDASAITRELSAAVEAADLEPRINADTSGVSSELTAAVDNADTTAQISADTTGMVGSIDAAVDAADTSVTIEAITDRVSGAITAAVDNADTTITIDADTGPAQESISDLGTTAGTASGGIALLGGSIGTLVKGTAALIGGRELIRFFNDSVSAASDLAESTSKATAVFGESVDVIREFGDTAATSVGLARQEAIEAAGTFGNLFVALGLSKDAAAELSPEVVQLGADLASFNNLGVPDTLDKLRSGLVGEIEPLRALGVSFGEAQVQAKAAELGLKGVNGELTEGEKVQARWALIVAQSSVAAGDFARTSDGLANQQRILQAEFKNLLADIGAELLPVFGELVSKSRDDLLPAFGELATNAVPLVSAALEILAPLLEVVASLLGSLEPVLAALGTTLSVVAPLLQLVASIIGAIPDPLLQAVATFLLLQRGIGALLGVVGLVAPALAASLGPLGLLVAGVAAAVTIFSVFGDGQKDAKADVDALTQSFADQAEAIDADVQAAAFKRIADKNQTDDLRDLGLSVREFSELTSQGASGFVAFIDTLERGGQVTPALADALRKTGGDVDAVKDAFARALTEGQGLAQSNTGLIESFVSLSSAAQDAAQAQLDALVVQEQITNAQADQAVALTRNADGTKNYVAALASLGVTGDATAEKIDGLSVALSDLVPASAIGDTEELTGALADFQSALDDQTQAAEDATAAQNDLVDAHIAALDSTVSNEQAHRDYGDALDEVNRSGAARFKAGLEAEAEAAKAAQDALNGLLDAQIGFLDSSIGAEEAARRLGDALQTASQQSNLILSPDASQTEEAEKAQAEFAGTIRDVRDAALAAAKADLRLAEDRAKANGGTLTAIQRQEAFAASLRRSAEQAAGPAQDAILALVNTYESLPKNIETKVTADTTKAQAAQKDYADSILGAREAAIQTAEADLALADARADAADRILTPVERQNIFATSLQATADKANGPVRDAILSTIDLYNKIPTGLRTEFDANTKPATDKVGTLSALIKSDVLTVATKPIDANIEPAKAKVAELSKLIKTDLATLLVFAAAGGKVPGAATGGTFSGPGIFQVGEQGREIINLSDGQVANVLPNRATEAVLAGQGNVALDPELSAAIRDLAGRPRVEATILASAPTASATYETAMETARQLDSLAARLAAAG